MNGFESIKAKRQFTLFICQTYICRSCSCLYCKNHIASVFGILPRCTPFTDHTYDQKNSCCRQMLCKEKVNHKQRDKAGRRVSGPVSDLAFRDVSISLLACSVQLSAPLSVVKDTGPIRAQSLQDLRGLWRWRGRGVGRWRHCVGGIIKMRRWNSEWLTACSQKPAFIRQSNEVTRQEIKTVTGRCVCVCVQAQT